MRVTAVQLDVGNGPKVARRRHALDLLERARGSDLILLPEMWPVGYFGFERYRREAEPIDGPSVRALQAKARDLQASIFTGSFPERRGTSLYNTSLLIDPAGRITAQYRKIHLFGFDSAERRLLRRGRTISVSRQPWGATGIATCYDLRFPELFRRMVDEGAEFFLIASAWPQARMAAWQLFNRARAHENLAWVLACNCAGTQNGTRYAGRSVFVDPAGDVIAEAGSGEALLTAEIDVSAPRRARKFFPALRDRVLR